MFGPLVLEIACGIYKNKISAFTLKNVAGLKSIKKPDCISTLYNILSLDLLIINIAVNTYSFLY